MTFTKQQRHDQLSKRFWDAKAKYKFYQQACQTQYQAVCMKLNTMLTDKLASETARTDIALDLVDREWIYQRDLAYLERAYIQELRLLQRDFAQLIALT